MFYFGAMFCKVQAWNVSATDCFPGLFVNFRFTMLLTKKELAPILIHFRKILTVKCLSNAVVSVPLNCREKTLNIAVIKKLTVSAALSKKLP